MFELVFCVMCGEVGDLWFECVCVWCGCIDDLLVEFEDCVGLVVELYGKV